MACRLAAMTGLLLCAATLPSCGEAVSDPAPAGADERQVLKDAAAMLPAPQETSRADDATDASAARPEI